AAAGNVPSRLLSPDRPGRQVGRARRIRQDIEKDGAGRLPDLLGFGRSDHARALESGRCRRTIVFCPVSLRFGYVLARRRDRRPKEDDKRAADETAGDGCHGFLVKGVFLMGRFLSSSNGNHNSREDYWSQADCSYQWVQLAPPF